MVFRSAAPTGNSNVDFVELGAAMVVASTTVPWRISSLRSLRCALISARIAAARWGSSSSRRDFKSVVASGTFPGPVQCPRTHSSPGCCTARPNECLAGHRVSLLQKVHAQHARHADLRPAHLAALRVVRFNQRLRSRPQHYRVYLGKEPLAPRLALKPAYSALAKPVCFIAALSQRAGARTIGGSPDKQRFPSLGVKEEKWPPRSAN